MPLPLSAAWRRLVFRFAVSSCVRLDGEGRINTIADSKFGTLLFLPSFQTLTNFCFFWSTCSGPVYLMLCSAFKNSVLVFRARVRVRVRVRAFVRFTMFSAILRQVQRGCFESGDQTTLGYSWPASREDLHELQ